MNTLFGFVLGPVFIHLGTALCLLALGRQRSSLGLVSLLGSLASLLWSLSLLLKTDAMPLLATHSFVADPLACLMLVGLGVVSTVTSFADLPKSSDRWLLHLAYFGAAGAFLTADLAGLFLFSEVFVVSFYLLLRSEPLAKGAQTNFVFVNILASALFLLTLALFSAAFGTLNMAELGQRFKSIDTLNQFRSYAGLMIVAFFIRSGLGPFSPWFWGLQSKLSFALATVFSTLFVSLSLYSTMRMFSIVVPTSMSLLQAVLQGIGVASMLVGLWAALSSHNLRKILLSHLVSQSGIVVFAMGLGTQVGYSVALFILFNQIILNLGLSLASDLIERAQGTGDVRQMGSFWSRNANLSLAFMILAFSLAGLPPLSGFAAKVFLFNAAIDSQNYAGLVAVVAVVLGTMFSALRLWVEIFSKQQPKNSTIAVAAPSRDSAQIFFVVILATLTIAIGLGSGFVMRYCDSAALIAVDRLMYLQAVLSGSS